MHSAVCFLRLQLMRLSALARTPAKLRLNASVDTITKHTAVGNLNTRRRLRCVSGVIITVGYLHTVILRLTYSTSIGGELHVSPSGGSCGMVSSSKWCQVLPVVYSGDLRQ